MKPFHTPGHSLGNIDASAVAAVVAAASDIALVVDGEGCIQDLAIGNQELLEEGCEQWLGRHWAETVTVESRPKLDALLEEADHAAAPRWRQVNHPAPQGADIPVVYTVVRLDEDRFLAVGREMRSVAALQQRLVAAQQSMDRDYARLRHIETLYRHLFQSAPEGILILDASTRKVVEANPAAGQLFADTPQRLVSRTFPIGLDQQSKQTIEGFLAVVRAAGKAEDVGARLAAGGRRVMVSASLFRHEGSALILVRVSPQPFDSATALAPKSKLLEAVEHAPDGFVVTDSQGRVISANRAFLDLIQIAAEEQVRGQSLDQWLGRPGVDLSVLSANLRQHGLVRLFATTLRDEHGSSVDTEISAVSLPNGEPPSMAFSFRNVGRRLASRPEIGAGMARSVEQLTELVGRVPLKVLVRESTDLIERLCIEAALQMTGDNRASAAEMLGLSRQSLYMKLHRYGLGELAEGEGD